MAPPRRLRIPNDVADTIRGLHPHIKSRIRAGLDSIYYNFLGGEMLFVISSSPDTQEFKTALSLAKDSDLCLIHDVVYFTREEKTPVKGTVYAIRDDFHFVESQKQGSPDLRLLTIPR